MNNLNVIGRYKEKNQSAFRVHFYLKNKLATFLQETGERIGKVVEISILQIYGSLRRMVDLSIGLKSDSQAVNFMYSLKKIMLPGQYGKFIQHQPIYSDLFKTYVKHNQTIQSLSLDKSLPHEKTQELELQVSSPNKSKNINKQSEQGQVSKELQTYNHRYNTIFIFAIPLEFKQRDVTAALSEKGIRTKFYDWKYKQDMQFLQIQLHEAMTQKEIFATHLHLEKYPVLIIPKVHQESVNTYLMKFQVQIRFQKQIDQIEFMKRADQVGGAILMIKDDFYGPRRYNVTFNALANLKRFQQIVEKNYKSLRISKPRYLVRICRAQKSFTFVQMMENLHQYELQLKQMKQCSPRKTIQ